MWRTKINKSLSILDLRTKLVPQFRSKFRERQFGHELDCLTQTKFWLCNPKQSCPTSRVTIWINFDKTMLKTKDPLPMPRGGVPRDVLFKSTLYQWCEIHHHGEAITLYDDWGLRKLYSRGDNCQSKPIWSELLNFQRQITALSADRLGGDYSNWAIRVIGTRPHGSVTLCQVANILLVCITTSASFSNDGHALASWTGGNSAPSCILRNRSQEIARIKLSEGEVSLN